MFAFNHSCSFIRLDWRHLKQPALVAEHILKHSNAVVFICGAPDVGNKFRSTKAKELQSRIRVETSQIDNMQELLQYFRNCEALYDDIFVSESPHRISVANETDVGTVLISETTDFEAVSVGPDIVTTWAQFQELAKQDFYGGLIGELGVFDWPAGIANYKRTGAIAIPYQFYSNLTNIPIVYAMGRYLKKNDELQRRHHHTRFIKKIKDSPHLFAAKVGKTISITATRICVTHKLKSPVLTWIPKKPSDAFDRNFEILRMVSNQLPRRPAIQVSNTLTCPIDFPSQKTQGSWTKRNLNVRGRYYVNSSVQERDVILFDDVYTSGSSLNECADLLLRAGALRVFPLTLAVTCDETASTVPQITCACGASLHIAFRNNDGGAFWGCPHFGNGKSHSTLDFNDGIKKIRGLQVAINDGKMNF